MLVVLNRIPSIGRAQIDDMNQHLGALNVPQESMSQACTFVGAFYQTGNIGDDEILLPIDADNTLNSDGVW